LPGSRSASRFLSSNAANPSADHWFYDLALDVASDFSPVYGRRGRYAGRQGGEYRAAVSAAVIAGGPDSATLARPRCSTRGHFPPFLTVATSAPILKNA
jgi:hypothetical protein